MFERLYTSNDSSAPPDVVLYHLFRLMSKGFFKFRGGVESDNVEALAADGPHLVVPNHEDWLDVSALGVTAWEAKRYLHFLAKSQLGETNRLSKLANAVLVPAGMTYIEKSRPLSEQVKFLHKLDQLVKSGCAIVNFAQESRYSHDPYVVGDEVKSGPATMALAYGLPITTAGIAGTRERHHIDIVYGEEIPVDKVEGFDMNSRGDLRALTPEIRALTARVKDSMRRDLEMAQKARKKLLSRSTFILSN